MKIVEVTTKAQKQQFLDLVDSIYKGDPNYVRPLNGTIEGIFSESNPHYDATMARLFLLSDENGEIIGRIAAFVNQTKAFGFDQPTGGVGFFECINNQKAAGMLFDAAKSFLQTKGMKAMDGPVNLGENDSFWGLLVDGFTMPGFGMNYNPPYYRQLFENYGFHSYFNQITNHLDLSKRFPERFWNIARRVARKDEYSFRHFRIKESDKFLDDFVEVYNEAWIFHDNFTPMDKKVLEGLFNQARPFLVEELIWFVYHGDEPVGFLVIFPDINRILQLFGGKLNWFNKLRFFFMARSPRYISRGRVVVLGIKPRFQRSGLESGLFYNLKRGIERNPHFKELELSWVGDFNVKMRVLQESMGAVRGKEHVTYRYIFEGNDSIHQKATFISNDTRNIAREMQR
jgi:hypothetical protein